MSGIQERLMELGSCELPSMFECVPLEQDFTTFDVSLSSILRFSTQFGPPTPQFGPPKPDFGPLGAHRPPPKTPKPPPDCSPKPPSAPEVDKYGQHAIRSSPLERERHPPNQNPHFESPLWGRGWALSSEPAAPARGSDRWPEQLMARFQLS